MAGLYGIVATGGSLDSILYKNNSNKSNQFCVVNPIIDNNIMRFPMPPLGDLIRECYLVVSLPNNNNNRWIPWASEYVIKKLSINIRDEIKDEEIIVHDADYIHIYNYLSKNDAQISAYKRLANEDGDTIIIPINLFDSFPICCTYPDTVHLIVELENPCKLIHGNIDKSSVNCHMLINSDILCRHDRQLIMKESDTIIEQVCCSEHSINIDNDENTVCYELHSSLPIKELMWVIVPDDESFIRFNYMDLIEGAKITINGRDIVDQPAYFFTKIQQYQNHSNFLNNVHLYAFGRDIEIKNVPNGTLNLAHIDKFMLKLKLKALPEDKKYKLKIYATQFNILRFNRKEAAVAYENFNYESLGC